MTSQLFKQWRNGIASIAFIFCIGSSQAIAGDNLVFNGTAEGGVDGWAIFISKQEEGKGAAFEAVKTDPHSGEQCLKMFSKEEARFAIAPRVFVGKIVPGVRCCFSAWVRAGEDFVQNPNTPGFYVRGTLFAEPGKDLLGGHYYMALPNTTMRGGAMNLLGCAPIPKVWTKLTSVFEIPADTKGFALAFTFERASGSLYVDDVSLDIVGPDVPLSPLVPDRSAK